MVSAWDGLLLGALAEPKATASDKVTEKDMVVLWWGGSCLGKTEGT
ncbi:MAG: hypothetical protein AVDCRST_MAG89-916 [uncultured Gemmatimonadetes bacterium]|uniref:Uncharacterized protein n=1 Tax=uncultured Gemmatimonadota bacterium TaxID=203437 RepID=A0A6J4KKP6_9BACT|nr:MAG: hypothetical protein AVDCRST_MAG89-916 [uncultured Gemmatimonadota bacterium]